jgi:type I restriction enzyme S subunit
MDKENKNIPQIRFKGTYNDNGEWIPFNDEWECCRFGDLTIRESKCNISSVDLPSVEYEDVIAEEGLLNKDISLKEVQKKGIIFDGSQVLYGKLRPYLHNWLNPNFMGVAVGDWWVLKPVGMNKNFIYRLIQTKQFDDVANQSIGSKMPRADWNLVSETEFMVSCSLEEQAKIGDYFSNLDHLISITTQELNGYKELKKCMLQKMFPKEGERVPEIRFPGFEGDWEWHRLGDLVVIERGGSPRPIDKFITNDENGLNWVKIGDAPEQGNYITKTIEKIKPEGLSKTREVHPGDLILSNSMSFGRPYIMAIDGCIHDGWLLIRDINGVFNLEFLCFLLGSEQMLNQYKSLAAGSTVNNLNKELVGNTNIIIPSLEEQQKIGLYFKQLDNLISISEQELNEYKRLKKCMLQKMFC